MKLAVRNVMEFLFSGMMCDRQLLSVLQLIVIKIDRVSSDYNHFQEFEIMDSNYVG